VHPSAEHVRFAYTFSIELFFGPPHHLLLTNLAFSLMSPSSVQYSPLLSYEMQQMSSGLKLHDVEFQFCHQLPSSSFSWYLSQPPQQQHSAFRS
jgi:hypothetical protein